MNKKKMLAIILAALFVLSTCGSAYAVTQASTTLSYYNVWLSAGDSSNKININFDVRAKRKADSVGVSQVKIYTSSGSYVTTITGTTSNGMIDDSGVTTCFDTYTWTGATPGTSYYALATVFAEIGTAYDDNTIMTNTAP